MLASDEAWWGSLWTEDARWDLGPDRVIDGRNAIVEHWRGSIANYRRVVQLYLSSTATIDGDEASGRAYFVELNVPVEGDRRMLAAYYDDTYRRTSRGLALRQPHVGPPVLRRPGSLRHVLPGPRLTHPSVWARIRVLDLDFPALWHSDGLKHSDGHQSNVRASS